MNEPRAAPLSFYIAGGTLRPGTPSYIARRADAELYERLLAGDFCYVLTARQMGKSSLMASTAKRLDNEGVRTAIVDLSQIGTARGATEATQWYFGVANEIHRRLRIAEPLRPWWQERADLPAVQRLTEFFRDLALAHCPGRVVVFIDEIDSTIGLPFADDFFAAIRACYNARATDPAFERLTFTLLGVASPDQLIQDRARTPFNVGHRIDLTDFTLDEACPLAAALHPNPEVAEQRLDRILYWTSGHPYLTQALCRAAEERNAERANSKAIVDPLVDMLFLSSRAQREESSLQYAQARLAQEGVAGRRLLRLYRRVRRGQKISDEPASPLFAQLKLAGVVKVGDDGRLVVRNRIYESVFTQQWAKSQMPSNRVPLLAAASLVIFLGALIVWYAVFYPRPYIEAIQAATEDYKVASVAYEKLHANPFSRLRAAELMAKFWDRRAMREGVMEHRDESLLYWLQALRANDTTRRRREIRALVGEDYGRLLATIRSNAGNIYSVAFSPDGRLLLTSGLQAIQLWDKEGRPVTSSLPGGGFSQFDANGRDIVTLHVSGRIDKRNVMTGQAAAPPLTLEDVAAPLRASFSLDGRLLGAINSKLELRVWDLLTSRKVNLPGDLGSVIAVAFGPKDGAMLTGNRDGVARIWQRRTDRTVGLLRPGPIQSAAFDPSGTLVITGGEDGAARIWHSNTGQPMGPPLRHGPVIKSVAFGPGGSTALTGGKDGTARLWSIRANNLEYRREYLRFQADALMGAMLSSDGKSILVAGLDHEIHLFSRVDGRVIGEPLLYKAAALSLDGGFVLTAEKDGIVRLRKASPGWEIVSVLNDFKGQISFANLSADGRTGLIDEGDSLKIWNTRTGAVLPVLEASSGIAVGELNSDGSMALVSNDDGRVWLWKVNAGASELLSSSSPVLAAAFAPDRRLLLTGSQDGRICLWDVNSERLVGSVLQVGEDAVQSIAFNPSGDIFFVATDQWLHVYSLDGGEPRLLSNFFLPGNWESGYRFPAQCGRCVEVILGYSDSFFTMTIHFDEASGFSVEGDPEELLNYWRKILALQFDSNMKIVPQWQLSTRSGTGSTAPY